MKKLLFFLTLTLSCSLAKADDMILQILQSDGQVVNIDLKDEPKTTYENGNLIITTTKTTITYPLEKVKRYTYVSALGISSPNVVGVSFSQDGETLTFKGLKPTTKIMLYSTSGQVLRTIKPNNSDKIAVSISQYPAGVYLVKVNDVTYKITKR